MQLREKTYLKEIKSLKELNEKLLKKLKKEREKHKMEIKSLQTEILNLKEHIEEKGMKEKKYLLLQQETVKKNFMLICFYF